MVKPKTPPSRAQMRRYERYKQQITALNLTPHQYQMVVQILAEILRM